MEPHLGSSSFAIAFVDRLTLAVIADFLAPTVQSARLRPRDPSQHGKQAQKRTRTLDSLQTGYGYIFFYSPYGSGTQASHCCILSDHQSVDMYLIDHQRPWKRTFRFQQKSHARGARFCLIWRKSKPSDILNCWVVQWSQREVTIRKRKWTCVSTQYQSALPLRAQINLYEIMDIVAISLKNS